MEKKLNKEVKVTATCKYETDGTLRIKPDGWQGVEDLVDNQIKQYRATVRVMENGHAQITPIKEGSQGSRYRRIYATPNGEVKTTQTRVVFQLNFPKRFGHALISSLLDEECALMQAFVKTVTTNTEWEDAPV